MQQCLNSGKLGRLTDAKERRDHVSPVGLVNEEHASKRLLKHGPSLASRLTGVASDEVPC
jgi:hypothetical protein